MSFSSFEAAQALAVHISEQLSFQPELCLRHISPRSSCTSCAQICPVDAISIERSNTPGQMVDMQLDEELCIHCGLCAVACPTSAFNLTRPSLKQLYKQALSVHATHVAAQTGAPEADGVSTPAAPVFISCAQSGFAQKMPQSLEVPCLGSLPWEFWLALQTAGVPITIVLPEGLCQRCPVTKGEECLIDQVSRAEQASGVSVELVAELDELMELLKTTNLSAATETPDGGRRRQFFSDLLKESKLAAQVILESSLGTQLDNLGASGPKIRSTMDKYQSDRKAQELAEAQEEAALSASTDQPGVSDATETPSLPGTPGTTDTSGGAEVHSTAEASSSSSVGTSPDVQPHTPLVGEVSVLTTRRELLVNALNANPSLAPSCELSLPQVNDLCTFCKACAFLCPTEALILTENKLSLNPTSCIGCALCEEICWPRAVQMTPQNALPLSFKRALTLHLETD